MAGKAGSERTEGQRSGPAARRDAPAEPTFSQAVAEIEGILTRLESEEIDVDDLSREVQRAVALIAICRAKLAKTETEVRDFVATLETGPEPSAGVTAAPGASANDGDRVANDDDLPF